MGARTICWIWFSPAADTSYKSIQTPSLGIVLPCGTVTVKVKGVLKVGFNHQPLAKPVKVIAGPSILTV